MPLSARATPLWPRPASGARARLRRCAMRWASSWRRAGRRRGGGERGRARAWTGELGAVRAWHAQLSVGLPVPLMA